MSEPRSPGLPVSIRDEDLRHDAARPIPSQVHAILLGLNNAVSSNFSTQIVVDPPAGSSRYLHQIYYELFFFRDSVVFIIKTYVYNPLAKSPFKVFSRDSVLLQKLNNEYKVSKDPLCAEIDDAEDVSKGDLEAIEVIILNWEKREKTDGKNITFREFVTSTAAPKTFETDEITYLFFPSDLSGLIDNIQKTYKDAEPFSCYEMFASSSVLVKELNNTNRKADP